MIGLWAAMTPARRRSPYEKPPGITTASYCVILSLVCHTKWASVLRILVRTECTSRSQLLPGKTTIPILWLFFWCADTFCILDSWRCKLNMCCIYYMCVEILFASLLYIYVLCLYIRIYTYITLPHDLVQRLNIPPKGLQGFYCLLKKQ